MKFCQSAAIIGFERACERSTFIKPRFTRHWIEAFHQERQERSHRSLFALTTRFLFDFHFKGGLIARNRGESSVLADPALANIFIRSLKSHSNVRQGMQLSIRNSKFIAGKPQSGKFRLRQNQRTMHGVRLSFATDSRGPPSRTNGSRFFILHFFPLFSSSFSSPFHRLLKATSSV